MSASIVRGVQFGAGISVGDRRAMHLHEYAASLGRPATPAELKAKMEELKKLLPDPENAAEP